MAGKKLSDSEEKVRYYHAKYVSYSRAIGVMWAVLTVCFAIIVIVSLVQPRWIGATSQSRSGFFGLYQYCTDVSVDSNTYAFKCNGRFLDFSQIPSGAYVAATVLVGIAVLVALVCVLLFVLFFFIPSAKVYYACFWLQLVCATLLFLACVIYPSGWSSNEVRNLCSGATGYSLGPTCSVQWAFILAIIGIFDAIVLAVLAFILATKQARLLSWEEEPKFVKIDYRNDGYVDEPQHVQRQYTVATVPEHTARKAAHHPGSAHDFSI